jgi:hypothetical protein
MEKVQRSGTRQSIVRKNDCILSIFLYDVARMSVAAAQSVSSMRYVFIVAKSMVSLLESVPIIVPIRARTAARSRVMRIMMTCIFVSKEWSDVDMILYIRRKKWRWLGR